jgi:hypothetical protein
MKVSEQSVHWNLVVPTANGAINISKHSYIVLCKQTGTLISFNTRALETNLAYRVAYIYVYIHINYCITIKNYNLVLQRGTQHE